MKLRRNGHCPANLHSPLPPATGMLTEHWFPADNPSKLRWFIRLKVVELMAVRCAAVVAGAAWQWTERRDSQRTAGLLGTRLMRVSSSLQLSLLPRPPPVSTVWHHLLFLGLTALQEQNGYLAARGTEQEQWLEGPDPELKQRLQDEIGQLRSVVTNGGVSAPLLCCLGQVAGRGGRLCTAAASLVRQHTCVLRLHLPGECVCVCVCVCRVVCVCVGCVCVCRVCRVCACAVLCRPPLLSWHTQGGAMGTGHAGRPRTHPRHAHPPRLSRGRAPHLSGAAPRRRRSTPGVLHPPPLCARTSHSPALCVHTAGRARRTPRHARTGTGTGTGTHTAPAPACAHLACGGCVGVWGASGGARAVGCERCRGRTAVGGARVRVRRRRGVCVCPPTHAACVHEPVRGCVCVGGGCRLQHRACRRCCARTRHREGAECAA